jgi:predicted DNA-binding transcriptional regulator AlpA
MTGKDLGLTAVRGRMITVKELSVFLRVSERWVELHMNDGTFPFPWFPINYKTRVANSLDIDEWLTKIRVSAGSAPLPPKAIKRIKEDTAE